MDEMQPINMAHANVVRIARLACTGEADLAAGALISSLRLRHIWLAVPVPIQTAHSLQLVLTSGAVAPVLLEQIQREFTSVADERALENWMLRDRASWLSYAMPGAFSDSRPEFEGRRISPLETVATKLLRPLRDHRMVTELAEFDQAMEVAKQPWPGKIDAVNGFVEHHRVNRSQSVRRDFVDVMTRPYGEHAAGGFLASYASGIAEALARARASVAAIAVARYRHDHRDLPSSLQQLVPAYLPATLTDPYTGAELSYRHDATGYKVYSVGINRKDDGGTWEQHSDLQFARRGNPPDIGIAVGPWRTQRAN
jgi:hypothetical protein